jgi:CDP-glycerol glycerophosphotransferase
MMTGILRRCPYWLARLVHRLKGSPTNPGLWVFGSRQGRNYDENSKHLFEYVNSCRKDLRAVWMSESEAVLAYLRGRGLECSHPYGYAGCLLSLEAAAAFMSVSKHDLNAKALQAGAAKLVQLWHGSPMKKTDPFSDGDIFDLFILAAEEYLHNGLLGNSRRARYAVTGYPKNDMMLTPGDSAAYLRLKTLYEFERLVLYLPTYREYLSGPPKAAGSSDGFDLFGRYGFALANVEEELGRRNALLVIKKHPTQRFGDAALELEIRRSSRVHVVDSADPLCDVYEYLKHADVLITDYSSVLFDYLLLGRPVVFAPFDGDDYASQRGLAFDYEEIAPGPKAREWASVIAGVAGFLDGNDGWAERREELKRRFNKYCDARSCERVCAEVRELADQGSAPPRERACHKK